VLKVSYFRTKLCFDHNRRYGARHSSERSWYLV